MTTDTTTKATESAHRGRWKLVQAHDTLGDAGALCHGLYLAGMGLDDSEASRAIVLMAEVIEAKIEKAKRKIDRYREKNKLFAPLAAVAKDEGGAA